METLIGLLVLAVLAVPTLLVVLLVMVSGLRGRVARLEATVAQMQMAGKLQQGQTASASQPAHEAHPAPVSVVQPVTPAVAPEPVRPAAPGPTQAPAPTPAPPVPSPALAQGHAQASAPRPSEARTAGTPRPDPFARAFAAAKRWLTTGNVPVKIGMLVLLAGVAALLRYAAGQLELPLGLRLAGVAAAALAGLVWGWQQRTRRRAFGLALQGGAIGILLLVVFAAGRLWGLIPMEAAFVLSVLLVAGVCVLAVAQDALALAVLGILAGFLAPIWLSTGSGNHLVLFSYYAVLNLGVFAIAWHRHWRLLELLGFVFTWGIGTLWGVLDYTPAKLATTQPFLLLFFALYLLIPLLHARRGVAEAQPLVDGALVFGTPLVAFALQAGLLEGERMPLALCALGLGALYAALAAMVRRRRGFSGLVQAYAVLAVGFATLAVPLALSARATASVFALEGAALVWLGLRQKQGLPRVAGCLLQLFAGLLLLSAERAGLLHPIANPVFMGALLVALAGFATAWSYQRAGDSRLAGIFYLWALAWWCGGLANEVRHWVSPDLKAHALLAAAAGTAWLAAQAQRRVPARLVAMTVIGGLALALPLALAQAAGGAQPLAWPGVLAWLVYALAGVPSLAAMRDHPREACWALLAWWLSWAVVLSTAILRQLVPGPLGHGWVEALRVLPWFGLATMAFLRWRWLRWPLGSDVDAWRPRLLALSLAALALWWLPALFLAGDAHPLPWVVGLNPLDLMQLAVLALASAWLWRARSGSNPWVPVLAGAAFALLTAMTLRAVHHWGGLPWSNMILTFGLAQMSLTIVWSVVAVAAWISGSRRGLRGVWLSGAVLMGVLLLKLVLVDRSHLGNLLGIGSFIGYGLLCILVGFMAPAPPREERQE